MSRSVLTSRAEKAIRPPIPICACIFHCVRPESTAQACSKFSTSRDVGEPEYYKWRSRSGCTFCFYQQKIEWVRLSEHHPDRFAEAIEYEKTALKDGSPFTWSQGESLTELIAPDRVEQIKADYEKRRERLRRNRRVNPLSANTAETIDDVYGIDEGSSSCVICHK